MFNFLKKTAFTSVALSGMVLLVMPASAETVNDKDTEQVSSLLTDLKTEAVMLSSDADMMEAYSHSSLSWQSHATQITKIKEHINEAGRLHTKLQELRGTAAPWQQVAIDRSLPMLRELADNASDAIRFINEKPSRLFREEYKAYLEANADTSSNLAAMIRDFVDYGNAEWRREELGKKLELPTKK